jgi:acetoin utilization deacetylase AcuC-like enzyme
MGYYKVFYSHLYTLPLPEGHRFPMEKYELLYRYLLKEGIVSQTQFRESPLATEELLRLAHSKDYIEALRDGSVDKAILQRIGFPWSPQLYQRSCATVGGAYEAALSALEVGVSGCLAGGTHHAHYDRGEGYCVFNDIAVVSEYLLLNKKAQRIAIIDLDVHQGNGNSSILGQRKDVFIASIHGEKNYPFKKVPSHLDIALREGAEDAEYIEALDQLLKAVDNYSPDFIFYQMGVDPLKEDKLGKMNLSFEGLMNRDQTVLQFAKSQGIPVSLALGGGYAAPIELTVEAYANTYRMVNQVFPELKVNY